MSDECRDPLCPCWWPFKPNVKACVGNVEIWDQTVGCPECNWNLWDWDKWAGDVCFDEAFRRFFAAHPFQFEDCHDDGDEDTDHWKEFFRR